jgi:hypothetical protein
MNEPKHKHHVTETPDVSHIKNVDVTHEASDVQVGSIAKFVIGLLVLTIVTHVALWVLFVAFERREAAIEKEAPRSKMALSDKERLPPEPRLQGAPGFAEELEKESKPATAAEPATSPVQDPGKPKDPLWEIKRLQQQWNEVLEQGPIDQNGRRFGMPIEKAKVEILKQGLPVRKQ